MLIAILFSAAIANFLIVKMFSFYTAKKVAEVAIFFLGVLRTHYNFLFFRVQFYSDIECFYNVGRSRKSNVL